jgi:hypothetical protein
MQRVVVVLIVVLGEDYRKEKQDYQKGIVLIILSTRDSDMLL